MNPFVIRIALFLFGSGFCALVYQIAWLRMLKLVFGASTAASAAVVAIFMGGLGLGGWILGRRADRVANPLDFYARLEVGISLSAALSLWLIAGIRYLYRAAGAVELGFAAGSALRLVLAAAVLAVPTFLMGGTLPATVRAAMGVGDHNRRTVAGFYAVNTLGAVLGAALSSFVLVELLGLRQTVLLAAGLNLLIALVARSTARRQGAVELSAREEPPTELEKTGGGSSRPLFGWVLVAAAGVGFVFFLMELVWYRMLAPILGGSTYTFALILIVALLGIGTGGLLYGVFGRTREPTPLRFAATCTLEALFLAVPLALGDRIAFLALQLRDLQAAGFGALVLAWTVVAAIVVLPAALVAGYQFPLLVALLGHGRRQVGREVGLAYAWNTAGAIGGSIAGGFGLLPLLSAPTTWRLSVWLLLALAALFLLLASRRRSLHRLVPVAGAGALALLLSVASGPSAFWRHGGIGAGRIRADNFTSNQLRNLVRGRQRAILWEVDGRESSVALVGSSGLSFLINGKSDGHARNDAPTQVMSGLIGALLHRRPTRSLVVGLGTGSSAGWLAEVRGMDQVDVVELEPAILRVAEACEAVNQGVLSHPKVNVVIADGREYLLTSERRYDVVFSEPSNPYRAGIASLFTEEFYRAVQRGLDEGGVFVQWLQGYEIDAQVVRTVYATLGAVFDHVETWQVYHHDLLLLASDRPLDHDLLRLTPRLEEYPFREALSRVWGVTGVEGFYAGYVASPAFARAVRELEGESLNTDDRPLLEFSFARQIGGRAGFSIDAVREVARLRGEERPPVLGELDWARVEEAREARSIYFETLPWPVSSGDPARRARQAARVAYTRGDLEGAYKQWFSQEVGPESPVDLTLTAESLAEVGDERALALIEELRAYQPVEAGVILSRWHLRSGRPDEALDHLLLALDGYLRDPWPRMNVMQRAFVLAGELLGQLTPDQAKRFYQGVAEPFAVHLMDERRKELRVELAKRADFKGLCVDAVEGFEPHVPWTEAFLRTRRDCYEATSHPRAPLAQAELDAFYARQRPQMWWGLLDEPGLGETPDAALEAGADLPALDR